MSSAAHRLCHRPGPGSDSRRRRCCSAHHGRRAPGRGSFRVSCWVSWARTSTNCSAVIRYARAATSPRSFRIEERHAGPPTRRATGEVDAARDEQAEAVQSGRWRPGTRGSRAHCLPVGRREGSSRTVPDSGSIRRRRTRSGARDLPTQAGYPPRCAIAASESSTALCLLVDAHRLIGRLADRSHPDPPVLAERADHVEHHSGLPGLVEVQPVSCHDVEQVLDGQRPQLVCFRDDPLPPDGVARRRGAGTGRMDRRTTRR